MIEFNKSDSITIKILNDIIENKKDRFSYHEINYEAAASILNLINKHRIALLRAVEQRDAWAEYAGPFLTQKHLGQENAELSKIIAGENNEQD